MQRLPVCLVQADLRRPAVVVADLTRPTSDINADIRPRPLHFGNLTIVRWQSNRLLPSDHRQPTRLLPPTGFRLVIPLALRGLPSSSSYPSRAITLGTLAHELCWAMDSSTQRRARPRQAGPTGNHPRGFRRDHLHGGTQRVRRRWWGRTGRGGPANAWRCAHPTCAGHHQHSIPPCGTARQQRCKLIFIQHY